MKRPRRKRKYHSLSMYVIFSIAMLLVYTVAELCLSSICQITNDVLTENFFRVFGGEILLCALIKIFKLKETNKYE